MGNSHTVYGLYTGENDFFYVGSTVKSPEARMHQHIAGAFEKDTPMAEFIKKHHANVKVKALAFDVPTAKRFEEEGRWIESLRVNNELFNQLTPRKQRGAVKAGRFDDEDAGKLEIVKKHFGSSISDALIKSVRLTAFLVESVNKGENVVVNGVNVSSWFK